MIANERQYRITKAAAEKFQAALSTFNELELVRQGLDPIIIEAQRNALAAQLRDLEEQLARYEALRSGEVKVLVADGLSEIGAKLIEARIAQGLTQKDLAVRLGMKEQQVQRYEQERYQTANLSRIAEVARALSLTLDARYLLSDGGDASGAEEFNPRLLPAKEMKKRGWFRNLRTEGDNPANDFELAALFVSRAIASSHVHALHRQKVRAGGKVNQYALLAWKARVLQKARRLRPGQPRMPNLDPVFIKRLVSLSALPDGPVQAVKLLRENGIMVVFEERLAGTHLDGAAMLLDEAIPVIGLTLRHDRLDNFWFVLMHELAHVVCHRDEGLRYGFFDEESSSSTDKAEREADEYALNALIPDEVWNSSFVRFARSKSQLLDFAKRRGIGSAIVAGRIRNERKDFSLFSDMVGNGQVRALIAEAGLMEN